MHRTRSGSGLEKLACACLGALAVASCAGPTPTLPGGVSRFIVVETPSATLQPESTATEKSLSVVCVMVDSLRVREGPGTSHEVVGGLRFGDCVSVDAMDPSGEWLRIAGGIVGAESWISGRFTSLAALSLSLPTGAVGFSSSAVPLSTATRRPTSAVPKPAATDTRWPTSTRARPTAASTRWRTATSGPLTSNGGSACHPSYPGVCLLIGIGDYDCAGGSGNGPNYVRGPIRVVGSDPFGLDRDGDGWGCE